MKSNDLSQLATQRELDLFRQPEPNEVPIELLRKQQGAGAAFTLACTSSGLLDQTIYEFVGIDAGTFSKIKKGIATLQADLEPKFCYAVNNRIYPEWRASQLGCTLVEIRTEAERRADQAERERDAARAENKLMRELLAGRVPA